MISVRRQKNRLPQAVGMLKQLAHPVRLALLCALVEHRELHVGALVAATRGAAGQSQVSQFLAAMRRAGLVRCRRQAQTIYYSLQATEVRQLIRTLHHIYCR